MVLGGSFVLPVPSFVPPSVLSVVLFVAAGSVVTSLQAVWLVASPAAAWV